MDNEHKNPEILENDNWLDALLGKSQLTGELGADESAMEQAGLTHPDDLDVERIVQETLAEIWQEENASQATQPQQETQLQPDTQPVEQPQQSIDATQMFQPGQLPEETAEPVTPAEPAVQAPTPERRPMPQRRTNARRTPGARASGVRSSGSSSSKNREKAAQNETKDDSKKERPKMSFDRGLLGMLTSLPHIASAVIWFAIVVAIGVSLGRVLWVCAADVLAFNKEPVAISVTVTEEDTVLDVAKKLESAGLVQYPSLFEFFADLTGKGENISVGTHNFSGKTTYDYNALINAMTDYGPARETVDIMFPEGYNCAQIFALLEENGVCSAEDLEAYAANGELEDYWFLEGVKRGHKYCLEGYLAPDTYTFYVNDDPADVLEKFLDEFDDRFSDHLRQRFIELNQNLADKMRGNGYGSEYIADHQLTLHDVIIIASIIEKESGNNIESYTIASVFYNRLADPSDYPTLDSDATILYATEYYNKGELITDSQINKSPFNTYTNPGLPYGPISNPGLNSLGAAMDPQDTDYFFFVYDEEAEEHLFSETYREHQLKLEELGLDG